MPEKQVKLFGERNSGTRYLSRLLALNLPLGLVDAEPPSWIKQLQTSLPGNEWLRDAYFELASPDNLGWKHALPDAMKLRRWVGTRPVCFITLTKNPYAWLVSLYRRPHHQHWRSRPTFETFLSQPWKTLRREGTRGVPYPTPMALWNSKNRAYVELGQALPVFNLTYEKLLNDPASVLDEIARFAGFAWDNRQFENIESSTKKSRMTHADYREYYASESWRSELSAGQIEVINSHLDQALMGHFGYPMLPPDQSNSSI